MNLSICPYCNRICTNNVTHICKQDVHLPYERSAFEDNLQTSSEVLGDLRESSYFSGDLSHVTESFIPDNANAHRDFSSEAGVLQDQSLICTNPNNMNDRSTVEDSSFQPTYSKWGDEKASREIPLESYTDCFQKTDLNEKHSSIYLPSYSTNSDKITENNFIRTNSCSESMEESGNILFTQIFEKNSDPSKKQQLSRNNSFVLQQQTGNETEDNTNGNIPKHMSENPLDSGFKFGAPANSIQNKYFCSDCLCVFGFKYELNENFAIRDNCMSFICELCRKEFIHPSPLKDGVFENTQDDCLAVAGSSVSQPFNSAKSRKTVDTRAIANSLFSANHKITSIELGKQFSELTERLTSGKTEVNLKEDSVRNLEEEPFFCKICDRSFTDEPHLNSHKLLHTGKRPLKCNLCETEYSKKERFKQHSFTDHLFNCDTCDRRFINALSLVFHKFIHTEKKPTHPTCQVCGKKLISIYSLQRHIRRFHKSIFFKET